MSGLGEYWKAIVDTMMDGVVVVDTKGTILSVNRALERITGYNSDELIGKPCTIFDCDTCFSRNQHGEIVKRCHLFTGGGVGRRRCRLHRKDGRTVHVLKNAAVLEDGAGSLVGGVETMTDITDLVEKEQVIEELRGILTAEEEFHGIVGRSARMLDMYKLVRNASASSAPIIIYGESGTGKELVANAIHEEGKRNGRPFVKVSCAVLNEALLESELFGHVKGAFTGADRNRRGRFEAAHKGDLFLDEIGDIPLSTQVKLLRVLQEKELERVGDQTSIPVDVRIIAATHRDLTHMCELGSFRQDLYYRLNVIPIHVPPLRERHEDIPLLVDHFIRIIRARMEKPVQGVSEEAMETLVAYPWPGNVRELVNVMEYAFVVCHEELIAPHHLPIGKTVGQRSGEGRKGPLREPARREELVSLLEKTGGNRQEAARLLGVSRVTFWKLLKKWDVKVETSIK